MACTSETFLLRLLWEHCDFLACVSCWRKADVHECHTFARLSAFWRRSRFRVSAVSQATVALDATAGRQMRFGRLQVQRLPL